MGETNFAGAKWLRDNLNYRRAPNEAPREPSAFGLLVADILGQVWMGLYHMEDSAIFHKRTDWSHERYIEVVTQGSGGELATYDGGNLTMLVLLCHEAAIRLSIRGCGPGYLRLTFHRRQREGNFAERHPSIQKAIENYAPFGLEVNGKLPKPATAEV